jgi:poly(hydroxyalkanoate) depolymerase family esterase
VTLIDPEGMATATRLTREGRLTEATAMLQRLLAGGTVAQPAATGAWTGPTIDLVPDLQPAACRPAFDQRDSRHKRTARQPAGQDDLPGQWLEGAYANPFGRRPYKLYVPAHWPHAALPLVVMLHGCTQSPDDFARGTAMNRLAEALGWLVVYPGQVQSANASKCWNWFQPTDQERERGEPSLIAGITREVMREHAADANRVYIAGLSAGGAKAAIMAAAYPDLYAAVAVHSGLANGAARDLPSALAAMRGAGPKASPRAASVVVPTIVFHGASDRTVHPGNAEAILGQALANASPLTSSVERGRVAKGHAYRLTRHATADGQTLIEDWRVQGLGHAWSGGDPKGSYTDPKGPDASRAMLDFFQQHSRSAPA